MIDRVDEFTHTREVRSATMEEIGSEIINNKMAFDNKTTIFTSRKIGLKTRKKSVEEKCTEQCLYTGVKPGR